MDERGWQASLRWLQEGNDFHARLSGPLGSGAVEVAMSEGALQVRDSRGVELSGSDVDDWSRETFGQPLPVEGLSFWLLGLAQPDRPVRMERGEDGMPRALHQSGWEVRFDEWARFDGRTLPRRLSIARGEVRVRLVVHRWRAGAPTGG
jgi:outer membrane lipoprotein LolB